MKMGKIAVTPNNDKAASHSKDENLATNTIKKNVKPKYGDAAFLEYTRLIVNHPNYF
ncbi:Alw26I/Eco31I/Esp3I family type II restriction endonuclease, partial [Xanthomonas citri pv. citri]|nr:Alw26I/Eco31I/Esp3I family type II restriction endonuclease [Xanthomonas citri pv. citri]